MKHLSTLAATFTCLAILGTWACDEWREDALTASHASVQASGASAHEPACVLETAFDVEDDELERAWGASATLADFPAIPEQSPARALISTHAPSAMWKHVASFVLAAHPARGPPVRG